LPETRAVGMGIFYTLFYLCVVLGPWIGGYAASVVGNSRVTFDLGATMLLACCVAFWFFQKLADDARKPKAVGETGHRH